MYPPHFGASNSGVEGDIVGLGSEHHACAPSTNVFKRDVLTSMEMLSMLISQKHMGLSKVTTPIETRAT